MTRTNRQPRGQYARRLAYHTRKNASLLTLGALFLAGLLLGTLLVRTAAPDSLELLLRLTGALAERRRAQSMLPVFLASLGASLAFVGALFLLGFSAVSQPLAVLLPFFRGLGAGFSMASLYARHGMGAVGFVGVLMLPGMLLSTVAMLVSCRESLRLSSAFFSAMTTETPARELYPLRLYFARFVSSAALCGLSALLEALLYFMFANSFLIG